MPRLWCAISDHGFGHAAQVVPVLQELGRRVPDLHIILRTTIPATFFARRLDHVTWELRAGDQGGGCVQQGPINIDIPATWEAYRRFHDGWEDRVLQEAAAIKASEANLVFSNISYLALEAAARSHIPAIGLGSLSWDRVLEAFGSPPHEDDGSLLEEIRAAYRQARVLIRPTPGIALPAFSDIQDVGPITCRVATARSEIRTALETSLGEFGNDRIVLVAFGGVLLDTLPFERLEACRGYRFVVDCQVPPGVTRCRAAADVPFSIRELVACSDIVITKPGYGTVVEAVVHETPVVYVRRHTFVDEAGLVAYLHRYGRAVELSLDDFAAGAWKDALDAVVAQPPPKEGIDPTGADEAAAIITTYF